MCRAVRYHLIGRPLLAYACHCHDCQTRSGSAFALTLVVRTADLQIMGDIDVVKLLTPSGRELDHHVCSICKVRLFAKSTTALDFASLRAGTLDDASWVFPVVQAYTESAIPWALIPGVREVSQSEFDFAALGREWRAKAPSFIAQNGPGG